MSDVLCIYYSRTGKTKKAIEEISKALDAETVSITDNVNRDGWRGFLRSGLDAMRKTTKPLQSYQTEKALKDYRLVILGTPIWAGRCSSVVRSFLNTSGRKLTNVAYVVTRGSGNKYEEVYGQMDHYLKKPHVLAVSLRSDSVGYPFWQKEFVRQVQDFLNGKH